MSERREEKRERGEKEEKGEEESDGESLYEEHKHNRQKGQRELVVTVLNRRLRGVEELVRVYARLYSYIVRNINLIIHCESNYVVFRVRRKALGFSRATVAILVNAASNLL